MVACPRCSAASFLKDRKGTQYDTVLANGILQWAAGIGVNGLKEVAEFPDFLLLDLAWVRGGNLKPPHSTQHQVTFSPSSCNK